MEWLWIGQLVVFAAVAFVQNMAFTWVSRSRNSGDPAYHRWAALCSNGVWFLTNVMVMSYVWAALKTGSWGELASAGVVYVLATSEGSVAMMRYLLKHETGKRRVGSRGQDDEPSDERRALDKRIAATKERKLRPIARNITSACAVCGGAVLDPPCVACDGTGKKVRGL